MIWLVLGLFLWFAAHFFKRAAPDLRARMGDPAKGAVALTLLVSIVLMVIGYKQTFIGDLWYPPPFLIHVNNLLMLLAFYLFAASGAKSKAAVRMRHPQLIGFKTWAVAHLLVNGDWASVILFGGLLAWAVAEVIVINRAVPEWEPPEWKGPSAEIKAVLFAVVAFAVVAGIHMWLGYWPFPG
jgi:uncharacterized membrane protein